MAETPANFDPDAYLSPLDVLARTETKYDDLDAAIASLNASGVDTDTFDVPWKTDCPF